MATPPKMTPLEWHAHVRLLADSRCRNRHPDIYDAMICTGPSSIFFGPPCDECFRETEAELEQKQGKAHGRELSPEEALKTRQDLGIDDLDLERRIAETY